jgi:hypothetical protein
MVLVSVVSRTRSPTFGRNRPCLQRGGKTAEKIVALPSLVRLHQPLALPPTRSSTIIRIHVHREVATSFGANM